MILIFSLISLLFSIGIPLLILFYTNFNAIHFSLFFIVPVGAIIVGFIGGFGFFFGLRKKDIYISKKYVFLGILLSLITVFGIKYGEYKLTCYTGNDIVFSTSGDHISNYIAPDGKPFNFISYTKLVVENTPISFSYKTRSLGSVTNPIICWIFFAIDVLGVIIGGALMASVTHDVPYCHTCSKYMDVKDSFGVLVSKDDEFMKDLKTNLDKSSSRELIEYINKFKVSLPIKKEPYFKGIINHCSECRKATLVIEQYSLNRKNSLEKNSDFKFSSDINYDAAMTLLKNETAEVLSV